MSSQKRVSGHWLFLDPRSQDEVVVGAWRSDRKPAFFIYKRNDKISLLEFIIKKLNPKRYTLNPAGIIVVPGPGGFSNVRSAVTLANALGFALRLPIAAVKPKKNESTYKLFARGMVLVRRIKPGRFIRPVYGQKPHITLPKV